MGRFRFIGSRLDNDKIAAMRCILTQNWVRFAKSRAKFFVLYKQLRSFCPAEMSFSPLLRVVGCFNQEFAK